MPLYVDAIHQDQCIKSLLMRINNIYMIYMKSISIIKYICFELSKLLKAEFIMKFNNLIL